MNYMENYVTDLLDRMNYTDDRNMEAGYQSSDTISWKAHREAESLKDAAFIPLLISFLDKEKDKKKRDKAYFALGHLAKNTNDITALNFLIKQVEKEKDKYIISSLLDRIAALNKPAGTDLHPLLQALKSDKWLIRHSAIQALNNSSDAVAESTLIELIDTSGDSHDITYSNSVLNKIGTLKAIPSLEKHANSRKRDVKASAKYAIEEILKREKQAADS